MEIELEAQCFCEEKKLQHATLELKQGTKSVQAYYDELSSCLCRANAIDDLDAIEYFKRGLSPKIATAIEGRYARSVRGFLIYAIKEEKKWEYYCKKKRSISPSKKMKVDDSTPTPNCLRPLENTIVDGGTFAPGVQVALEEVAVDDHCSIDAPCYADLEMQQNPSENESHIAKLSERDKKSALSNSTKYEVESIHNESERNTPHKKRGLECKACEDVFDSNKRISTFSVVSPNVCKEKDEEMVVNPMKCQEDKRIEKIDLMENYPTTALSINHDDKGDVTTQPKDAPGVLKERDPSYDEMLKHMVGRITTKPGGKPEMGEAFVVDQYNRPLPRVRTSRPEPGEGGHRQLPPGTINVAHVHEIIQLYQGKSSNHPGPMSVDEIASKFRVEASVVQNIVQFVSLPQEEHSAKESHPVKSASEESKVVVVENGKMVDVQDKEITMEGLCSISSYDQWARIPVSGPLPKPRYKHAAAVVQEKMYVFGGNHNGRYLGDMQVLDFKSLSWSKLEAKIQSEEPSDLTGTASLPPCAGHALVPWGNKILCLAGHTREPTESLSVKEFDPQTCTWSTLRTYGRSPSSRGGQSVTLVGGTLVVFGGEGDGRSLLNDLHVLDLETMTWDEFETTGTPPSPRSEHAAACYADHYLLIFGGGSHSTCFSDLHLLDMQTMEWSRPEHQGITPEPRAGHAGVTVGENWFITGGGNNKKGVPETLVLNMSTFVWSVVTSLEGRAPPTSEIYALKSSRKSGVPSGQLNEPETNGLASVAENSSRGVIFEIEELQDEKIMTIKRADTSKTLLQAVKGEKSQIEEKLNQEELQSSRLKQELANVETKNERNLVCDQLSAEVARASQLENEISDLQQRLQKMETLEKECESLRLEKDAESDDSSSDSNQRPADKGFWRWNG
uniref:Acyl-CoA-binding domain-containing protein n=1 Tax=Oryza meridionalis TaxID=40149 RepID=A0A0E0FCY4_9ORYZ